MRNDDGLSGFAFGLLVGIWAIILIVLFLANTGMTMRNCPLEDSCHPEYRNGVWYIENGER